MSLAAEGATELVHEDRCLSCVSRPQDERVEQNIARWGPSFLFNTAQSLAVFLVC